MTRQPMLIAYIVILTTMILAKTTLAETPEVGGTVPDFTLSVVGEEDREVTLSEIYPEGPTVVVVLRGFPGYQCPVCSKQVHALVNRAKIFSRFTEKIILVYPGPADQLSRHARAMVGSRSIPDPLVVVRDPDMEMVKSWGLRWNAPHETAYPATFVLNSDGAVVWSKVSDNHAGRAQPEEILKMLRKMKQEEK